MYKCTNCSWEGDNAVQGRFCFVCGDNVEVIGKPKDTLDITGDGKFDKKDLSKAGKVLAKGKKGKRKYTRKNSSKK